MRPFIFAWTFGREQARDPDAATLALAWAAMECGATREAAALEFIHLGWSIAAATRIAKAAEAELRRERISYVVGLIREALADKSDDHAIRALLTTERWMRPQELDALIADLRAAALVA
ncbi:hypothetical protein HYV74_01520 [Candidatus Uhrbacteria bacterium]|nr:hypothetical protein [Candidatus Uhrbacteria bacterium]